MDVQNLSGQVLGQYELRELLGVGGMGAVYKAHQRSLKRYVALKVLSTQFSQQAGALERFNREAETSAALEHPHIIHVYDYGTQQGINYLVMQLLTGGTLAERLEHLEGKLPSLKEVAELLRQVASALDYAHSQGVIHRDIKPNNVMFDNHGTAYLVDFGIARLAEATRALTESGMVIGTLGFMAPEQWRASEVGPATDQYALGIMIYSLVTGKMPFEAPTPAGIMHKHLNEMPTPPNVYRPGVPEAATEVLERAMAKRAEDRFPTCTSFAQAFDWAIQGSTGEETKYFTTPIQRNPVIDRAIDPGRPLIPKTGVPPRPVIRHTMFWGMGLVILALLMVIGFMVLSGNGDKDTAIGTSTAPDLALVPSEAATETSGPSLTVAHTITSIPPLSATELQQTIQAEIYAVSTGIAPTSYAQGTQTAVVLTPLPSLDVEATAIARVTQTQVAEELTPAASPESTATTWTDNPTATATKTATFTPEPPYTPIRTDPYLIKEDFEDGKIQMVGFSSDPGWKIVTDETGNRVLEIDNQGAEVYKSASFGEEEWNDYAIEYRLRFLVNTGSVGIELRGCGPRYYMLDTRVEGAFILFSDDSSGWKAMQTRFVPVKVNTWHVVRAEIHGNQIEAYFDGDLWIEERDNTAQHGCLMLAAWDTYAQVDDISVWQLTNE